MSRAAARKEGRLSLISWVRFQRGAQPYRPTECRVGPGRGASPMTRIGEVTGLLDVRAWTNTWWGPLQVHNVAISDQHTTRLRFERRPNGSSISKSWVLPEHRLVRCDALAANAARQFVRRRVCVRA